MDFKEMARENQILKIRVGSHLFGTSTPDSDEDFFGIFMPPDETIFGFQRCDEVDLGFVDKDDTGRNTKEAVDFKIHDYRKFLRTVSENNPNFIHAMFVNEENILFTDEYGFARRLLEIRDRIVHKGAYKRFVAYAHSQQHKMRIKPLNYAALENGLVFLEILDGDKVMADAISSQFELGYGVFKDSGKGKHIQCGDLQFERGIFIRKARKMIRERLSRATNRHVLFTRFGYDSKFASNLIHLLMAGRELMDTGKLVFPLTYAQDVLDVKNGKYTIEQISEWSDELLEEARAAYEKSDLPAKPWDGVEEFAMRELYEWSQMTTRMKG